MLRLFKYIILLLILNSCLNTNEKFDQKYAEVDFLNRDFSKIEFYHFDSEFGDLEANAKQVRMAKYSFIDSSGNIYKKIVPKKITLTKSEIDFLNKSFAIYKPKLQDSDSTISVTDCLEAYRDVFIWKDKNDKVTNIYELCLSCGGEYFYPKLDYDAIMVTNKDFHIANLIFELSKKLGVGKDMELYYLKQMFATKEDMLNYHSN